MTSNRLLHVHYVHRAVVSTIFSAYDAVKSSIAHCVQCSAAVGVSCIANTLATTISCSLSLLLQMVLALQHNSYEVNY